MDWYFFTWNGGKAKWSRLDAATRDEALAKNRPVYVTILDVNNAFETDEIPADLKYRGDLYFDFDGNDKDGIDNLLDDVRYFMRRLDDLGVNLDVVRWWLTGGRGVHCTIPYQSFCPEKDMVKGIANLPLIYKEMALALATDYLDLKVYTGKKGRQWRTTYNARKHDDGTETWKVPVTASQLKAMREPDYWEWCSKPREEPPVTAPYLVAKLIPEFAVAVQSVRDRVKTRPKTPNVLKAWAARKETPPTIEQAFNGEGLDDSAGLNDLKIQLVTAAIALGIDNSDDFIKRVEGFIAKRIGKEGVTHNTRRQIEGELRKTFDFLIGDYTYKYSPEAFGSVLSPSHRQSVDLRGIDTSDENKVNFCAETRLQLASGMTAHSGAVLRLVKDTAVAISDYSWDVGSLQLVKRTDEEISEYSIVPIVDGKKMRRTSIPLSVLTSHSKMIEHIARYGGTAVLGSSKEAQNFKKALLNFVGDTEGAPEVLITPCEGLHVIPLESEVVDVDAVNYFWVESQDMRPADFNVTVDKEGKPLSELIFRDADNPEGKMQVDLNKAPSLATTAVDIKETTRCLLNLNDNSFTLGVMLGWMTGAIIKEPLYKVDHINTFPLLQIVGQAGSGKTTAANLFLSMFSFKKEFMVKPSGSLTPFAFESLISGSTTIPVVMDEFKYQNLDKAFVARVTSILQNVYTIGLKSSRGGGASGYQSLTGSALSAPVGIMSETLESSQSSILERSVVATFNKANIAGRSLEARYLLRNQRNLGILGKGLLDYIMKTKPSRLIEIHKAAEDLMTETLHEGGNDRIVNNATMLVTGLDVFIGFIADCVSEEFIPRLEAIRSQLIDRSNWTVSVTTEVSRMLRYIADSSQYPETVKNRAIRGVHYVNESDGAHGEVTGRSVVLSVDRVFILYREIMKSIDIRPAFNSQEDLLHALSNSVSCTETLLHKSLGQNCVRLDVDSLEKEGVPNFL